MSSEAQVPQTQGNRWQQVFSEEDLLDALRRAAARFPKLSKLNYIQHFDGEPGFPSSALITKRLGSWNQAKRLAGLQTTPGRRIYKRKWSRLDCLLAIQRCHRELGKRPSYRQYAAWASESGGVYPSGPLLRLRFGDDWKAVLRQAGF